MFNISQFKINLVLLLFPFIVNQPGNIAIKHTSIKPVSEIKSITKTLSKPTKKAPTYKISDLVNALILVESNNREKIIGDKHLGENYAAGVLQIRPVMLKEVNRILKIQGKTKRYQLKDRFNRQKSIEMFHIWRNFHHKNDNFEKIVRNWNGGPRGYLIKSTQHHWIKTQKFLVNI